MAVRQTIRSFMVFSFSELNLKVFGVFFRKTESGQYYFYTHFLTTNLSTHVSRPICVWLRHICQPKAHQVPMNILVRFPGVPFEPVSIKTVEAVLGAKPHKALPVLVNALHIPVREPIFNTAVVNLVNEFLCTQQGTQACQYLETDNKAGECICICQFSTDILLNGQIGLRTNTVRKLSP